MKRFKNFVNENIQRILVYNVDKESCEKFCEKYPDLCQLMKTFKPKDGNLMSGYRKFLKHKDKLEKNHDEMIKLGYTPETIDSPSFGKKTFYHLDWCGVNNQ